jgi:hypothetical protein
MDLRIHPAWFYLLPVPGSLRPRCRHQDRPRAEHRLLELAGQSPDALFQNDPSFDNASIGFPIPWASIAVLVAATALASLAATAWPARKASRIRPAVALRIAD